MTTNSFASLTTSKPEDLIREFRKKVATGRFNFDSLAIEAYRIQYTHNKTYHAYVDHLIHEPLAIAHINQIPFLPIEFFKSRQIKTGHWKAEKSFKSSGTTRTGRSIHAVDRFNFYLSHASDQFRDVYGDLKKICLIAVLPSYQEQGDSSLIAMVDDLIRSTEYPLSGYYLAQANVLGAVVKQSLKDGRQPIVIGVSYALLDIAEAGGLDLSGALVIETGGMKGRRREMIRKELHDQLKSAFNVGTIHSEYGMTELLSQAYSKGDGIFSENRCLHCLIRDINDPLSYRKSHLNGGVNIIDLANIHSCCFIETKDIGRKINEHDFEILGRFDNSDIRGCNLLL